MSNSVETTSVHGVSAAGAAKGKDAQVDGDAFAAELEALLAENGDSTSDKITKTMERLSQALPGMSVGRGLAPSLGESPGYYLKSGSAAQVTISEEMLVQMADDSDMFAKVKEMIGGLFSAGNAQSLMPATGRTTTWQSVTITAEETRYVETSRDNTAFTTAVGALTLKTQELINSTLDLLLTNRNQNSNGRVGNSGATQSWGFSGLMTNSSSWQLEMGYSSGTQALQSLRSSQTIIANLEVAISQLEGGASNVDLFSFMQITGLTDPLVFDLGGEGINLTSAENGVYFDIKGDGTPVKTAWITGNNAFLYLDQNGNGIADDAHELFGDHDGHANGFEKLAQYDSNGDGVIDENDEIYSQLRLWRDLNSDGVNQADESLSLADVGIKSINLGYGNTRTADGKGNVIGERSTFTWADGKTGEVADAWLKSLRG